MKALVKLSPGLGNVAVIDVERPALPGPDWALIRVRACGVCGTDVHVWQEKFQNYPPVTLGHEFSGEIDQLGAACTRFSVGDRVVAEPGINACGACEFCRSGRMHLCRDKLTLGWRVNGAMTDYIAMPERMLHAVPDGLNHELAALCEPLAVVLYNIAEGHCVSIGDYVVVQGSGPIGVLSAYVAKTLGARRVLLTGVDASEAVRFDIARACGADRVLNVMREDMQAAVMDETDGRGADCVVETSGAPAAIAGSVALLKKTACLWEPAYPRAPARPFRGAMRCSRP